MIKFIDLFSGMGGMRIGFQQACEELNIKYECVFSAEIKSHARNIYIENFNDNNFFKDVSKIKTEDIEDFDVLLAGFPCQAFSNAGKRMGFQDTRGTLFFEIARILKEKKPKGFLLENVGGLLTHNKKNKNEEIGETFKTILHILEDLNYKVSWKYLDSQCFGVPQSRKRVYITGSLIEKPDLENFNIKNKKLFEILESNIDSKNTLLKNKLLSNYKIEYLYGKSIKDKRGGNNNIHSWDLGLKGEVNELQKTILKKLIKERRKKNWSEKIGIDWMDGIPLTLEQIHSFNETINIKELKFLLEDLTKKKYLKYEYPKKIVYKDKIKTREYDNTKEKGYNIVTGNLSFEINTILDPKKSVKTILATDANKLAVIDPKNKNIREITNIEFLRLFGFPENYKINTNRKDFIDLIGNTVVVPVIKEVSIRLINNI